MIDPMDGSLSSPSAEAQRRSPPRGGETARSVHPTNPSAILQLAQPSPNRWLPESDSQTNCSRQQAQAPAHGGAPICT
jgi:hypothetical protein